MIEFADFLLISGFTVISVIMVMLWLSKKRQLPQEILIGILSLILIIIVTLYANVHKLKNLFIAVNLIEDGARFLIAPLLFIYIKSIFVKEKNLIKSHFLHFAPFLLFWSLFSVPKFVSRIFKEPVIEYLNFFNGTTYLALLKDVYLLVYIYLSAKLLMEFRIKMKSNYSSLKEMNFGWLNKFLAGFLLTCLFDLSVLTYYNIFHPDFPWDIGLLSLCFLILVTIYLGYQGLRQSKIYLPEFLMDSEYENQSAGNVNIKPLIDQKESKILKTRLEEVMLDEQPYLLQELTLNMLAAKIETTDKKLSVVLNQYMKISFYDLVNQYRVAAVKENLQLEENQKYSLLGIAYSCGFNSKSSFYRAFKKETGSSPTAYKMEKTLLKESHEFNGTPY